MSPHRFPTFRCPDPLLLLLVLAAARGRPRDGRRRDEVARHPGRLGRAPGGRGDLGRAHDPGLPGAARLGALARRARSCCRSRAPRPGSTRRTCSTCAAGSAPAPCAYDSRRGMGEAVFYGVTFSPGGKRAWASGGGQNVVHAYAVGKGLREIGDDPDAVLPGRDGLRQDPARPPHLRRQQPRRRGGGDQPARPHGDGDRSQHQPRDGHDRPRPGADALRGHLRPQRPQGLRDELDGALGVRHRHAHGARDAPDPALAAEQPAARRPPERDRHQPAPPRGLHRQRQLGHGVGHRRAPRPRDPHDARRPGARRAHRRDAQRPGRQPRRQAALRRARRRERDRGARPRAPQADRLHPDGVEPDRRRHHAATARSSRSRPPTPPGAARAAAPGPTRSATARPATSPTRARRAGRARRAASAWCARRRG